MSELAYGSDYTQSEAFRLAKEKLIAAIERVIVLNIRNIESQIEKYKMYQMPDWGEYGITLDELDQFNHETELGIQVRKYFNIRGWYVGCLNGMNVRLIISTPEARADFRRAQEERA